MNSTVEVAAALIWAGDRFLICRRPPHKARGGLWEFAGGKLEQGETPEQALVRECKEELGVTVTTGEHFMQVVHEYPDITVRLTLINAVIADGEPELLEHGAFAWITADEAGLYEFCPADSAIIERIKKQNKLFNEQKKTLDTFLASGAITKAQYEKSIGTLAAKMAMLGRI